MLFHNTDLVIILAVEVVHENPTCQAFNAPFPFHIVLLKVLVADVVVGRGLGETSWF